MAVSPKLLGSDPLMERNSWATRPDGKPRLVHGWEPDPQTGANDQGSDVGVGGDVGKGDDWSNPIGDAFSGLGTAASGAVSGAEDWLNQQSPNLQQAGQELGQAGEYLGQDINPVEGLKNVPSDLGNIAQTARHIGQGVLLDVPSRAITGQPFEETGLGKTPVLGGAIEMAADPSMLGFGVAGKAAEAAGVAGGIGRAAYAGALGGVGAAGQNQAPEDVAANTALNVGLAGLFEAASPIVGRTIGAIRGRIQQMIDSGDQEGAAAAVTELGNLVQKHALSLGPGAAAESELGSVSAEEMERARNDGTIGETTWRQINRDPNSFQHRTSYDVRTGSANRLPEEDPYSKGLAKQVTVWQDNAGKDWMVNGHNRYSKAESQGKLDEPVSVYRLYETNPDGSPGVSAAGARAFGAFQNIADGTADPVDIGSFLREMAPGQGEAEMKQIGVPTTGNTQPARLARMGIALSHLSDPIWRRYVSGDVDEKTAEMIGGGLPDMESAQASVLSLAEERNMKPPAIQELVDEARVNAGLQAGQKTMFGDEDPAMSRDLLANRAEIKAALGSDITSNRRLYGGKTANATAAEKLAAAGNTINVEGNRALARTSSENAQLFQAWKNGGSDTARAITEAAIQMDQGAKLDDVLPGILDTFRSESDAFRAGEPGAGPSPEPANREDVEAGPPGVLPATSQASLTDIGGPPEQAELTPEVPVRATAEEAAPTPAQPEAPVEAPPAVQPAEPAAPVEPTPDEFGAIGLPGTPENDAAIQKLLDDARQAALQGREPDVQSLMDRITRIEQSAPPPTPDGMTPQSFIDTVINKGYKGITIDREPAIDALTQWIAKQGGLDLNDPAVASVLMRGVRDGYSPYAIKGITDAVANGASLKPSDEVAMHFASFRGAVTALDGSLGGNGKQALQGLIERKQANETINQANQNAAAGAGPTPEVSAPPGAPPAEVSQSSLNSNDVDEVLKALGVELHPDAMERLNAVAPLGDDIFDAVSNEEIKSALGHPELPQLPPELKDTPVIYKGSGGRTHPIQFESDFDKAVWMAARAGESRNVRGTELPFSNWLADTDILSRAKLGYDDLKEMRSTILEVLKSRARTTKAGAPIVIEPIDHEALPVGELSDIWNDIRATAAAEEPPVATEPLPGEPPAEMPQTSATAGGAPPAEPPDRTQGQSTGNGAVPPDRALVPSTPPPPEGPTPPGEPPPSGPRPFVRTPGNQPYWRVPNVAAGLASSIGVYQSDQDDDEKSRIVKALMAFPAGAGLSHVVVGGPGTARAIANRAQEAYISGILTPMTFVTKSTNDVAAIMGGPIIRATQALFQGRIGTLPQEAIAHLVGEASSLPLAWRAFVRELDPELVNQHPMGLGHQAPSTGLYEQPSMGQFSASISTRMLKAVTEFARVIVQQGVDRANDRTLNIATGKVANGQRLSKAEMDLLANKTTLPDPQMEANRALLLGKPTNFSAKLTSAMLEFLQNGPSRNVYNPATRSIEAQQVMPNWSVLGKVLTPFTTIPANLVGKTVDWMPVLGLLNMIGSDATSKEQTLIAQALSVATVAGLASMVGTNINGAGPIDQKQKQVWFAQHNQPFSVKIGGQWVPMRHLPAPIRGPLMAWGSYVDSQRYGLNGDAIANELGSSLTSLDFFPQLFQLGADMAGGNVQNALKYFAASEAGSVVPWEIRKPAQGERATQADISSKYVPNIQTAAARGFESSLPGVEKNVPAAINPLGEPKPNTQQGAGWVNPFRGVIPESDPTINAYSQRGIAVKGAPSTLGGVKTSPEEQQAFVLAAGPQLVARTQKLMSEPAFQALPQTEQVKRMMGVEADVRRQAGMQVLRQIGTPAFDQRLAATPGYQQRPLKYTGTNSRGQELIIDDAIRTYQNYLQNRGNPAPTPEQMKLAQAYIPRQNPSYKLYLTKQAQTKRATAA